MDLNPVYTTVGKLFDKDPMFVIPKYQRAYAWDTEPVKDFLEDLKSCFSEKMNGREINHFFGGILSVSRPVQGVVSQVEYEIIDGQQRVATFTLLVSCMIKLYKALEDDARNNNDVSNEKIIKRRIEELSKRFIAFDQEVQRNINTVKVLKLSKADDLFYRELIQDMNPTPTRDSHERLKNAHQSILEAITAIITPLPNLTDKMDSLEVVKDVIDGNFTILHMVTTNRDDAFRLFQVINDRGMSLTEGDLLRAKTLEILEPFSSEQDSVESLWDQILADAPAKTASYLHWIYESYQGKSAPKNALFDKFLEAFFPQYKRTPISQQNAQQIYSQVSTIFGEIQKCKKILDGQWPYPERQPITGWDRNRFYLLMKELNHELSIPLLLAASNLDHRIFSEMVQILEKVFFRYKIICNQHATPLQKIYREESVSIRTNPANYSTASLKQKLQALLNARASNQSFKSNLEGLQYKETGGGSNKALKYFLLTAEYYYPWFNQGASGTPTCLDKNRIYDFSSTTIEHVYPRNAASSSVFNANLEPVKNSLGNLTILDPAQNGVGADDDFLTKRPIYQASSVFLTREKIASNAAWTATEISAFKDFLVNIGMAVFQI